MVGGDGDNDRLGTVKPSPWLLVRYSALVVVTTVGFVFAGVLLAAPAFYAGVAGWILDETWLSVLTGVGTVGLPTSIGLCGAVLLAARLQTRDWRGMLGLRPFPWNRTFSGFLALSICLGGIVASTPETVWVGNGGGAATEGGDRLRSWGLYGSALDFIVDAMFAASSELLFRGYLYHRLRPELGSSVTILLTSTVSATLFSGWGAFATGTVVGSLAFGAHVLADDLLLGLARERMGSTWACIVLAVVSSLVITLAPGVVASLFGG